ncbi:helix-turn-helix domain-containing protein [Halosegnis sp.]|uniref:helix-turn-helix domain-containing protein n=1 Tax=Halosegnis sp. TaxID=2864959 RepID=UPI0035D3FAAF
MREVVLLVRHHGEPESDISAAYPEVTLRSRSSLTGRAASRKRIIELSGPPEEITGFIEEFSAADPVHKVEPLSPLDRDRVFAALTFDATQWDSIAERLSELGVLYRSGTVIKRGWERWTLYLDADDDLAAVVDHLEEGGNETELRRDVELSDIHAPDQLDLTSLARELTARQTEVLTTAVEMGYYESNRDTSIEDVGEAVGVSRTTAWEHLNRAERKVMAEIHEFLEARQ